MKNTLSYAGTVVLTGIFHYFHVPFRLPHGVAGGTVAGNGSFTRYSQSRVGIHSFFLTDDIFMVIFI